MAQGDQLCLVLLELIGQVFQTLRPMGNRCCVPLCKGRGGNINGLSHQLVIRIINRTNDVRPVVRAGNCDGCVRLNFFAIKPRSLLPVVI